MSKKDFVRINFPLVQDEDGYPPVTVESLWASQTKERLYQIENIPFFVKGIAVGDEVSARDEGGVLWFERRLKISRHSTLRLVIYEGNSVSVIRKKLKDLGCSSELSHLSNLISIDIPPSAKYSRISKYLEELAKAQIADYEESALRH